MKKTLLLFLAITFTIHFASAQVTLGETSMMVTGTADEELFGETTMVNETNDTLNLRWVRTINSLPAEWDNYFCAFPGLCGLPNTDSLNFELPPADIITGLLQCHCEPHGIAGMASVTVRIINNANDELLGTVDWICDAAPVSTNELEKANIKLFPNPANDEFRIVNGDKVDQIIIYNIIGKKVKYFAKDSDTFFIGDLVKGLYFVQLIDQDAKATKTLKLKKN